MQLSGLPNKARWGSLAEHDAEQALGECVHQLGPRSLRLTFGTWEDGDVDGDDDYRQYVKGKVFRSVAASSDHDYGWRKCSRSWSLEPVDHMLMRIQFNDERGNAIRDFQFEDTCPLTEMHKSYCKMLDEPATSGPLQAVFMQFQVAGDDVLGNITSEARHLSCSVDSQA